MGNNRLIARNSIFLTIRMAVVLLISLFTTRFVLKGLGVVDYGIYNVVCGFVSMFAFLNASLTNGVQRFYNYSIGENDVGGITKVYNISIRIQVVLIIILLALVETFGMWFLENKMVIPIEKLHEAKWVFQLAIISFVFIILQVPFSASIIAFEKMDYYAIIGIIDAIFKLIISLSIPLFSVKLVSYGIMLATLSMVDFLFYSVYAKIRFSPLKMSRRIDTTLFVKMLTFSGWNIFGSFSGMIQNQGLNVVLNLFFGPVVNAARGISNQVSGAVQGFVANIGTAVRPQLVQSYASGDVGRCISLTYGFSKISSCFFFLMSYPICLEIDYILNIWLGEGLVPSHSNSFVILIIIICFVNNLNSAVSAVVHATGKMKKYQLVTSTVSLLSVPAAYVAVKCGSSPEFAVFLSLVFTLIGQYLSLIILRQLVNCSLLNYFKDVLKPILAVFFLGGGLPLIPYLCMEQGLIRFILVLICSVLSISIVTYFVGLTKPEKKIIISYLQIIKNKYVTRKSILG